MKQFLRSPLFFAIVALILIAQFFIYFRAADPKPPEEPKTADQEPPKPAVTNPPPTVVQREPESMPWDKLLDEALDEKYSDEQSVQKLLEIMPSLPEGGQIDAVWYMVDLVEDEKFDVLKPFLLETNRPLEMMEIVFDDVMARDYLLEVDVMNDVVQNTNHPLRADALEILADYLGVNHSNNLAAWTEETQRWLELENRWVDADDAATMVRILSITNRPDHGVAREILQEYLNHDFGTNNAAWVEAGRAWYRPRLLQANRDVLLEPNRRWEYPDTIKSIDEELKLGLAKKVQPNIEPITAQVAVLRNPGLVAQHASATQALSGLITPPSGPNPNTAAWVVAADEAVSEQWIKFKDEAIAAAEAYLSKNPVQPAADIVKSVQP